jgi:hypothetical protein
MADVADRLRAEHPGEPISYGISYGPDGPPTHSVAQAFFGTGPEPEMHGAPILWVRTRSTPWIRAEEPLPERKQPGASRTRKPSRAELERRLATAERKHAETCERLERARHALAEVDRD